MYFCIMKTCRTLLKLSALALAALPSMSSALEDLPAFYDYYCAAQDPNTDFWFRKGTPDVWTIQQEVSIGFNCETKYEGTSALEVTVANDVTSYYDLIMKFANNKSYVLNGYKDLRFMVKNLNGTAETLRWTLQQNSTWTNYNATGIAIPATTDWTEVVIPLSSFSGYTEGMDIIGFGIRHTSPDEKVGSALHLLIDQLRFTDGTDHEALGQTGLPAGTPPTNWPSYLMVGSLDARDAGTITASTVPKVGDYRYEYIMPGSASDYAKRYATASKLLNQKTGIVWYNFGSTDENAVAENLNNATYMTDYVTRYEAMLDGLAAVGQDDYILVLEPDMYGKLMQKGFVPNMSCADVPVYMDKANSVTGKTYASNLCGWSDYVMGRAREKLINGVIVGHMLNHWGHSIPGQVGRGRVEAHLLSALMQGRFLNSFSATGKGDVVFVEKCHRDAGTETVTPFDAEKGDWFWNEASYDRYFTWVRTLSATSSLRVVGWQVSEGNMSLPAANRDNTVDHFVGNPTKWAQAGFIGILFGPGISGQANNSASLKGEDTDNGWYRSIMGTYTASPLSLADVQVPVLSRPSVASQALPVRACGGALCSVNGSVVEILDLKGKPVGAVGAGLSLPVVPGIYLWRSSTGAGHVAAY
jgi:hypothetical protein